MELYGTTLIQESTSLEIREDSERNLVITLLDSDGDHIPNAEIILSNENQEYARTITNIQGKAEINLNQEDGLFNAEYRGSLVYASAENEIIIPENKTQNNIILVLYGIIMIPLIFGIISIYRRFYN
jgi:hypothetical protein